MPVKKPGSCSHGEKCAREIKNGVLYCTIEGVRERRIGNRMCEILWMIPWI